jgi:SAM-dependent methyltransferase
MKFKYDIDIPLDSPERTILHRDIIRRKVFLRKLYEQWYDKFLKCIVSLPEGLLVELGSGGGFFKEVVPSVICSDIIPLPGNDMTFSALNMPFETKGVSGIFMIDTFHHIPDSKLFLEEACRVLKPGGKIMMVEPANSFWGRFIYKNFHHEPFYPDGLWKIPDEGPLTGANGALPWIVFVRDCELFNDMFPNLKIESIEFHNPFLYLLSGGVSYRQLFPGFAFQFVNAIDKIIPKISKQFSMFMTIIITKN